jgi:hypothetical protein
MKADAGGRELFSGIHFGLDDWGGGLNEKSVWTKWKTSLRSNYEKNGIAQCSRRMY